MSKMKDYMMQHNLHLGNKTFDIKAEKLPNPLLKKYAARSKMSIQQVEIVWAKAKEIAANSVGKNSPKYWATVNSITQKELHLKEHASFKEVLLSE